MFEPMVAKDLISQTPPIIHPWDSFLFQKINSWSLPGASVLDPLVALLTDIHKESWFIYGVLPLALLFWIQRGGKKTLKVLLFLSLSVGVTDALTYRICKPFFQKPRPPAMEKKIQLRTHSSNGFGFPSNHAANNFAGALILTTHYPKFFACFYLWALFIAFSRIYVGVHYPMDVLVGALWGSFLAFSMVQLKTLACFLGVWLKTKNRT